ncbi:hypothetical protein DWY99_12805 [[Clostridium] leptum]|uniref:Uncharacterized protein n=1 Tax=[Clostridium] leptum TaxID=1535 RepID=A0A412AUK8_9FIRM|nr:hypothetical protein DWY99_12805 [[Clostridium] leptum]
MLLRTPEATVFHGINRACGRRRKKFTFNHRTQKEAEAIAEARFQTAQLGGEAPLPNEEQRLFEVK